MSGDSSSTAAEDSGGGGDEATDPAEDGDLTTTSPRYRWKGLSTIVTIYLVLLYPVFLYLTLSGQIATPDGTVTGILTLAWLTGIAYAVGPGIMKDVQEIRGG